MPGCRAPSSISHGCHTDSKVPPTRRGRSRLHSKPPARSFHLSSATPVHRPCRAERIYRRRTMAMPGLSTPTRSTEIAVFTNTPYVSRLRPKHRQPRAFLAEAPFLCASAKNRCGLRVDRLFPPPPFRFLHATFAMLRWHGAPLRLHSQTIFGDYIPAFPDTAPASRGRAASIPSPTRNLRLLFRAVDAMPPLSILRSAQADNLRTPSHP